MVPQGWLQAKATFSLSLMEGKKPFCPFPMEERLFWGFFWLPGD